LTPAVAFSLKRGPVVVGRRRRRAGDEQGGGGDVRAGVRGRV